MKEKKFNRKESLMPIYLYMILKNESSKESPLSRSDIYDKLTKEYELEEIKPNDRKTIPRHIRTLATYFPNSIVENEPENGCATTWYFNSSNAPSLGGNFSVAEINFLIDMLIESKIISSDCTAALIHKLAALVGDVERKDLRVKTYPSGTYKSENRYLLEIKDKVYEARSEFKQINITYEFNNGTQKIAVMPVGIVQVEGKYYLRAYWRNKSLRFHLENIKSITIGEEPESLASNYGYDIEDDSAKLSQTIALDALFFNTREINYAIKHNKYLTFTYLSYSLNKENKVKLMPSAPQMVVPINTAYKNGNPYLIAVDPQKENMPVFYRIDLIKDIKSEGTVDFVERKQFDEKEPHEYIDSHPYMLPGFTKKTMEFAIREGSLDRVIDAFGNKAICCGSKKGWELGSDMVKKLSKTFSEFNFSEYLGLDHNATYCVFRVQTTEEEIKRFALENADVVEIERPKHIRDEIKALSEKMVKRYTKKNS